MSEVKHFTDMNFNKEVLESDQLVLVDFWAGWCAPCRFLAPVVESLAKEYAGKIKVGKLDVDDNPSVANDYGISGIPTLALFKKGKVVDEVVGVVPQERLKTFLDKHLNDSTN